MPVTPPTWSALSWRVAELVDYSDKVMVYRLGARSAAFHS